MMECNVLKMQTVWVVMVQENLTINKLGVFSTKENAEEFITVFKKSYFYFDDMQWEQTEKMGGIEWTCYKYNLELWIDEDIIDYPEVDCWDGKQIQNIKDE